MSGQLQQAGRVFAGFWRRALAAFIDVLAVAVLLVAAEAGYLATTGEWTPRLDDPAQAIVAGAVALAAALYDILLTWRLGGTLGKRAVGIHVAPREGGGVTLGQVLARFLARLVSTLPALLGFFWAGWDRRKQTWHDKLADTVVVRDDLPVARPVATDADVPQPEPGPEPEPGTGQDAGLPPAGPDPEQLEPPTADIAVAAGAAAEDDTGPVGAPADPPPASGYASGAPQPWAGQPPPPSAQPAQPSQPSQPSQPPQQPWPPTPAEPAPPPQPSQPVWSPSQPSPQTWAPQAPQPMPQAMPQSMPQAMQQSAPPQPSFGGTTPPPPMPTRNDPNSVAIGRAGLGHDAAMWLQQVADQVDARLDRISATWRTSPHAEAARACAFGLLLGHLARLYPHMRPELNATAELHPSFSTLLEGSRLATLEQIVAEPGRMAAWLGPLIDVQDPERMRTLLD